MQRKPKQRKRKIWKKELSTSWSRKAHRHTKIEERIAKNFRKNLVDAIINEDWSE